MRLNGISIEEFGVWQDLQLNLDTDGLNVFYGPNEAGKTTLMRFVRQVLYGSNETNGSSLPRHSVAGWSGTLIAEHQRMDYELSRMSQQTGQDGPLSVMNEGEPIADGSQRLLQGIDRRTYENVFAIGLVELQELGTLTADEAARSLYELSFGPSGQRIVKAIEQARTMAASRFNLAQSGRCRHLLHRRQQLQQQLVEHRENRSRYEDLLDEKLRLDEEISGDQVQLDEVNGQIEAHRFLARVWHPWKRVRDLESELRSLPEFPGFPDDAESRLNKLSSTIQAAEHLRDSATSRIRELNARLNRLPDFKRTQQHAGTMRGFLSLRDWVEDLEYEISQKQTQISSRKQELHDLLTNLGSPWTIEAVSRLDTNPGMSVKLMELSRKRESTAAKARRMQSRLRRIEKKLTRRAERVEQGLRDRRVSTVDRAIEHANHRTTQARDLCHLRIEMDQLEQHQRNLNQRLEHDDSRTPLPGWVNGVMSGFLLIGIILCLAGVFSGLMIGWISGIVYTLLGLCWIGFRLGIRQHLSTSESVDRDRLRLNLREVQNRANSVRQQTTILERQLRVDPAHVNVEDRIGTSSRILAHALDEQAQLEQMIVNRDRNEDLKRRCEDFRNLVQNSEAARDHARQQWQDHLESLGLEPTLSFPAVMRNWQIILKVDRCKTAMDQIESELHRMEQTRQNHLQQMLEINALLDETQVNDCSPLDLLDKWFAQLADFDRFSADRSQIEQQIEAAQNEVDRCHADITDAHQQQATIWAQAGAVTADEFDERLLLRLQREETVQRLDEAQMELLRQDDDRPPVAITEQDLEEFDSDQNRQRIDELEQQLWKLEPSLRQAHETLGMIKRDIAEFEDSSLALELRFELAQVEAELREEAEDWFAARLGGQLVDELRIRYEQEHQPATLSRASRFLSQLTRGRYTNIWCPLGSHELQARSASGESLGLDQLSGGTREQLFLAIRFALIENYAEQGIELPVILDDLFVNFDQERTEAAVETVMEFAEAGQQILLFTCHLHLAHLFESRGIVSNWLPTQATTLERRAS